MKLYDLKAGTNPRRVRVFLAEKGVTIPTVQVDMMAHENSQPEFLAKNPMGKMPVLELDDGTFLAESMAICRYIDELHPSPPLFGSSPKERALIEMWNRRMEFELLGPIGDGFTHISPFWIGRRPQIPEAGKAGHVKAAATMAWLDKELKGRRYIAGDVYSVADITAQCALLLGKNTGVPIGPELQHLGRWFADVTSRPTARA